MNLPSEWLEIHPWSVPFSAISPQPSDRSQHGQFTASSETSLHHLLLATGNSWFLWKVHVNAPLKKLGDTGIPNLKQCENNLSTCWSMCAFLMYSTGGPIGPTNPRRLELVVKHVPCAISWWFTSLSCSKAVYPLVANRVNYTNYPGIRVSSLRIPEESLDMNAGSPQFLDVSCANPHVCVCVLYV